MSSEANETSGSTVEELQVPGDLQESEIAAGGCCCTTTCCCATAQDD